MPDQHLPIQHQTIGKGVGLLQQIGEAPIDQLLAAAPEKAGTSAPDQLATDAIPFPLHQPLGWIEVAEPPGIERTGQKEGIGAAGGPCLAGIGPQQLVKRRCTRLKGPHQPLLQLNALQSGQGCQGPDHEPRTHPHPEGAREEFHHHQHFFGGEPSPEPLDLQRLLCLRQGGKSGQDPLHPSMQWQGGVDLGFTLLGRGRYS